MNLFYILIAVGTSSLMAVAALAFLRCKDVFSMTHIVMIANCYVVPLILAAITIENFSIKSLFKIIALILLNLLIANLLCYLIVRRAAANKIMPDAQAK
jgi:multisubunit Na+/H+ antiporter MnhG subunit